MASLSNFLSVFVFLCSFYGAHCKFTTHFNDWLRSAYGEAFRSRMERNDVSAGAAFGGRTAAGEDIPNPVVFVHGIQNQADRFGGVMNHFKAKGYKASEIYATTWGDVGKTRITGVTLACQHVKQVRDFIKVVQHYTGKKVDVLAYSMGSPIARKAILGGKCIDTGENLGARLTGHVDTFVGVAGANYGSILCRFPIGGVCGTTNGMGCGSTFLNDINSKTRYEGAHIFSIYSTSDDKVGYKGCGGQVLSDIPGQDGAVVHTNGWNHDQVMINSAEQQRQLVLTHKTAGVKKTVSKITKPGRAKPELPIPLPPQVAPFAGPVASQIASRLPIPAGVPAQIPRSPSGFSSIVSSFLGSRGGGGGIPFLG